PQLRQAIHLLQLSAAEIEQELAAAVESNPLLDWAEPGDRGDAGEPSPAGDEATAADSDAADAVVDEGWGGRDEAWSGTGAQGSDDNPAERVAEPETLRDHLLWQLHLSHLSRRDRLIGVALVDAIDDDGYLREPLESVAQALLPEVQATSDEIQAVLHQVQRMDPPGVGARDLGECLALQLALLDDDTPGKALALRIAGGLMERLQKAGVDALAAELHCPPAAVGEARPGPAPGWRHRRDRGRGLRHAGLHHLAPSRRLAGHAVRPGHPAHDPSRLRSDDRRRHRRRRRLPARAPAGSALAAAQP